MLDLSAVTGEVRIDGLEMGAIWAPQANLVFDSGITTNGQWTAQNVTTRGGGEIHHHSFLGQLPCTADEGPEGPEDPEDPEGPEDPEDPEENDEEDSNDPAASDDESVLPRTGSSVGATLPITAALISLMGAGLLMWRKRLVA